MYKEYAFVVSCVCAIYEFIFWILTQAYASRNWEAQNTR